MFTYSVKNSTKKMSSLLLDAYRRQGMGGQLRTHIPGLLLNSDRCFFLSRELVSTKEQLKTSGQYQHLKFAMNRESGSTEFLEYATTRRYYKTLEEWVTANGCTLDDVRYGRQDFNGIPTFITLQELISRYDEMDDLTQLFRKLRTESASIEDVMVYQGRTLIPGSLYIKDFQ